MKLYEIDKAIEDCIDMETGEIVDFDRLTALTMERDRKIEGVALWIKNLTAEAKALKEEKAAFADRQKAAEAKIKSLKRWLTDATGGEKFRTDRVAISFRKSEAVSIALDFDPTNIPDDLKRVSIEIDKTAVKDALKAGMEIPGVSLETKQNIQIK